MSRIMALDYGEKKIGVAISDKSKIFASSRDYILNDFMLFNKINILITENDVQEIVIGLPLKLDGADSEQTNRVKDFKDKLSLKIPLKITFVDERLSTSFAEKLLLSGNVSRKKRKEKIDSLSAQLFLQSYLDRLQKS